MKNLYPYLRSIAIGKFYMLLIVCILSGGVILPLKI